MYCYEVWDGAGGEVRHEPTPIVPHAVDTENPSPSPPKPPDKTSPPIASSAYTGSSSSVSEATATRRLKRLSNVEGIPAF